MIERAMEQGNSHHWRTIMKDRKLTRRDLIKRHHWDLPQALVAEFENKNYVEGNMFILNATLKS